MTNDYYYLKYVKYKKKYLQLSNKLGGAAAAIARPKKRSKTTITINIGDIFYVKWNMSDGTSRFYKSSVVTINKVKNTFTLRYSFPEEDGSHSTEIRKKSEIDKGIVLRESTYLEKFSQYPPKRVKVGEEYQATIPPFGSPIIQKEMQPLTEEQILKQAKEDSANLAPHIRRELEELRASKKD